MKIKTNEINKIYENKDYIIAIPLSMKAAQKLGHSTSWCTSTLTNNIYDDYNTNNDFIIYIINKKAKCVLKEIRNKIKEEYYKYYFNIEYQTVSINTSDKFLDFINMNSVALILNYKRKIIEIFDSNGIDVMKHGLLFYDLDSYFPEKIINAIEDYLYD